MNKKFNITIADIAKQAGVSKTTVSFYLNGKFEKMSIETKLRIKSIVKETGYSPSTVARSLKSKKTNLIGVIVADISNPFSSYIVKGIDDIARQENYQIIVGSTNFNTDLEKVYINKMFDMRVDGFIIQPTIKLKDSIQDLVNSGYNIVLLDSIFEGFKGISVKTNNYKVTYNTIESLIKKGYEEFFFISEFIELLSPRIERHKAFIDVLTKYKKKYFVENFKSPINKDELKEYVINNIDLSKKTVLFGANGRVLQTIFKIAKENNLSIPNPVGIIGFDDWGWQELSSPSVSAIEQPTYEEGKEAIELLIDMIENGQKEEVVKVLDCKINWRESTDLNGQKSEEG